MPYWTTLGDEGGGSITSNDVGGDSRSYPDPLSVSDLPSPLVAFEVFLSGSATEIEFEPTAFDHPVFIMFSSGTTGLPKCMVHGAGGKWVGVVCLYRP